MSPSAEEQRMRDDVVHRIEKVVTSKWEHAQVQRDIYEKSLQRDII